MAVRHARELMWAPNGDNRDSPDAPPSPRKQQQPQSGLSLAAQAALLLLCAGFVLEALATLGGVSVSPSRLALSLRDSDAVKNGADLLSWQSSAAPADTVKVALLADTALSPASQRVLRLIRDEGARLALHAGDIDYTGDVDAWRVQVKDVLGDSFPYFFSAGNYENRRGDGTLWERYVIERDRRLAANGVKCVWRSGDGAQTACHWRGLSFVLSNLSNRLETMEGDADGVKEALAKLKEAFPGTRWTFCLWHAPLDALQLGFRNPPPVMRSPSLLQAYESCREAGAVVVSGHEHYYARSHALESFEGLSDADPHNDDHEPRDAGVVRLRPGVALSVVSGLGGHSVSVPSAAQMRAKRRHMAAVHPAEMLSEDDPGGKLVFRDVNGLPDSSSVLLRSEPGPQGFPFGALFCELPVGAQGPSALRGAEEKEEATGSCYFKTIDGRIADEFSLEWMPPT